MISCFGFVRTTLPVKAQHKLFALFPLKEKKLTSERLWLLSPKTRNNYWKHTGVVAYYKAGAGIKFIQTQCRHSSLDETNRYLKDLGLFENEEIIKNAPEI